MLKEFVIKQFEKIDKEFKTHEKLMKKLGAKPRETFEYKKIKLLNTAKAAFTKKFDEEVELIKKMYLSELEKAFGSDSKNEENYFQY